MTTQSLRIRKVGIRGCFLVSVIVGTICAGFDARAELLQIIHTNDLHSYFEHSQDASLGGYAPLKYKMDVLRAEARSMSLGTLVLDAGDFGDGAPLYLAGAGEVSWNMMNALDYDAVALGNHDYLPGMGGLDRIVGNIKPNFALVAANFVPAKGERNLERYLKPYVEFRRGNLKVAVLGLTNSEFAYRWRVGPRAIRPMMETVERYLPMLRARNDVVIALTHLGTIKDKRLIRQTRGIDLVVGGHSHEFLTEPVYEPNLDGVPVPIVQAGHHGEAVGDLLLDAAKGRPLKVLRYQLHAVRSDGPKDAVVAGEVQHARERFETEYGREWLQEAVGTTEVPLHGPSKEQHLNGTDLVLHALRDAIGGDLALDNQEFYGAPIQPGPITREEIFGFYPRIFDFTNPRGWTVWNVRVQGWGLSFLMNTALQGGYLAHTLGMTFELGTDRKGRPKIVNLKVNGKPIKSMKTYSVAMPEGLARWAKDATWAIQHIVARDVKDSGISIWEAIERRLRKQGRVTSEIQ